MPKKKHIPTDLRSHREEMEAAAKLQHKIKSYSLGNLETLQRLRREYLKLCARVEIAFQLQLNKK